MLFPMMRSQDHVRSIKRLANSKLSQDELDRMDFEHHIFKLLLLGDLYLAPVGNPQRILDIGTGTGIWAIEIADKFPSATVIGTDLSPVQPSLYCHPSTCRWYSSPAVNLFTQGTSELPVRNR